MPVQSKPLAISARPTQEPAPGGGNSPGASSGNYGKNGNKNDDEHCDDDWVHLVVCYEECKTDP